MTGITSCRTCCATACCGTIGSSVRSASSTWYGTAGAARSASTIGTWAPRNWAASTSRSSRDSAIRARGATVPLGVQLGNERKTTGSYYTPTPLVEELLTTTLQPLIDKAAASGVPDDLLEITVCDPACGSGHFLVAAARRIARKYAAMQYGDNEPPPEVVRSAMHKVVARCVYGVDIKPLAAEVAKLSLWVESLKPGQPLAFLDPHIKVGNSLLGATPALLEQGLPDAAFTALEGDDKKVAAGSAAGTRMSSSARARSSLAPSSMSAMPSSRPRRAPSGSCGSDHCQMCESKPGGSVNWKHPRTCATASG